MIPKKYTCDGENINPPLEFLDVSKNAQSLVLIMDDPDAPSGTFTHWTVWNIDPKLGGIEEKNLPQDVVEGENDFGKVGYSGPCPPSAIHRYFFKLFALDTKLSLPESSKKSNLENALNGHIIDKTELVGLYSRGK